MNRRSIKQKLILISMGTTTAALLLACALFLAYDYASFRELDVGALDTLGTTLGAGSTAALAFSEPSTAQEALDTLVAHPNVTYGGIHDAKGTLFAWYFRGAPTRDPSHAPPLEPAGQYVRWTHIEVVQPITLAGEHIGSIVLHATRDAQFSRIRRFAVAAVGIILISWLVAFVITSRLQRLVSAPVVRLAHATAIVSRERNYGVRVERTSNDEVGDLVTGFNQMLEQIDRQDAELRRHRATLEEQVATRTEELTTANLDLAESRDRAEHASRAKSEFLANMSHEIRTPMSGVMGMLDLALGSRLPDEQREQLEVAKTSAESLLLIVNDILDFSKVEAGRVELDETTFVLRDIVEESLRTGAAGGYMKNLALDCVVDDAVSQRVVGDASRLRQVLINLIGNAVKFTERGSITVRVRLAQTNATTGVLHGIVSDTGIGIPQDKQASIFEAFTQADGSTTRRFGGTGLGLTISARLTTLMGGRLHVESVEGQGSHFHFTIKVKLPAAETVPAGVGVDRTPAVPAAAAAPARASLRVLVAEDNMVNQRVARGLMAKLGHHVQIASNGQEALDALDMATFDLVFMDMQMPVMGGLDAIAVIRAREREHGGHLPIIVLTAHALDGDREQFLASGADGYVSKPIALPRLIQEIDDVLRASDARASAAASSV